MQEQRIIERTLERAKSGSRTHGTVPLGKTASGSVYGVPFVAIKGAKAGKTLWINGQVHGNEITGIVAALDFVNRLDPQTLSGNVIVTSTANPLAMDARVKGAPFDGSDLDQAYPGRAAGFVTDRIAYTMFEEIRGIPDLLINMHTQGNQTIARSYTVYKEHPNRLVLPETLFPYMAAFDPMVACRMNLEPGQGELPGNIAGALDYQLIALGIPAFMVELGVGQRAEAAEVAKGIAGFEDIAKRMGILEGEVRKFDTLRRVTRRGHVSVNEAGFFRPMRKPADLVRAGEPFGEVMNAFGEVVERPVLDRDAIIIAIRVDPVMHTGDRFGYMAYEWDDIPLSS